MRGVFIAASSNLALARGSGIADPITFSRLANRNRPRRRWVLVPLSKKIPAENWAWLIVNFVNWLLLPLHASLVLPEITL